MTMPAASSSPPHTRTASIMITRRRLLHWIPAAGAAGTLAPLAERAASQASAGSPMLSEADPQAKSLGYVSDAKRVDKAKFPKYAAGQTCASCQLYQGKAGDASGPCAIFAGKHVAAKGWCSAYMKKA